MEPKFHDDKMIARYLLGELPEAEQTQLEEHAFSNSDYLHHVRAVEKDLIDEYARGELSGPTREAFEQRFFASEERRRQIEFARALIQVTGESPARASSDAAAVATTSWWDSVVLFGRGLNPALRFALAALALFVVIGGIWLFRESLRSRRSRPGFNHSLKRRRAYRKMPRPNQPQSSAPKTNHQLLPRRPTGWRAVKLRSRSSLHCYFYPELRAALRVTRT